MFDKNIMAKNTNKHVAAATETSNLNEWMTLLKTYLEFLVILRQRQNFKLMNKTGWEINENYVEPFERILCNFKNSVTWK